MGQRPVSRENFSERARHVRQFLVRELARVIDRDGLAVHLDLLHRLGRLIGLGEEGGVQAFPHVHHVRVRLPRSLMCVGGKLALVVDDRMWWQKSNELINRSRRRLGELYAVQWNDRDRSRVSDWVRGA